MTVYERDYPIVEVEWVDSSSLGSWNTHESYEDSELKVRSTGYLYKDLPDRIVLLQSLSELDLTYHQITIPRVAVISIVYLWNGEDE